MAEQSLDWVQDSADYSWHATDALGCFYRVSKVISPDGEWSWACAWLDTYYKPGVRIGTTLCRTFEEAQQRMNNIASFAEECA